MPKGTFATGSLASVWWKKSRGGGIYSYYNAWYFGGVLEKFNTSSMKDVSLQVSSKLRGGAEEVTSKCNNKDYFGLNGWRAESCPAKLDCSSSVTGCQWQYQGYQSINLNMVLLLLTKNTKIEVKYLFDAFVLLFLLFFWFRLASLYYRKRCNWQRGYFVNMLWLRKLLEFMRWFGHLSS